MKAILLVRVSSISQQLDEQTSSLINYAKTKGYIAENQITIDDTESAIKLDEAERKGLNKMKMAIANDSSINAVFVWELSRLTRKSMTGYSLRDYFVSNHIQLYCFSPSFQLLKSDLSDIDDNGSLLFALYLQMAESEMKNKKERFHRSKIRNARTGKYSGGFVKYGYKVNENGYYEINEKESELIRYVFNEYAKGRSIMNLRKELIERGKISTQNLVRQILISEAYTGISNKYGMNRVYPQIISVELFQKCRLIAQTNNRRLDKSSEIYFCKKLIKCVECGTHYIAMKSSLMYLCYGKYGTEAKLFPDKACKNSPLLNINLLDSLVWDVAKEREIFCINEDIENEIEKLQKQIEINDDKIINCTAQLQKIEKKRDRNNHMFFIGQIKEDKYNINSSIIDRDFKELNNLIVESHNGNEQINLKLQAKNKKVELIDSINNKSDYIESITDDNEKQQIVQKNIKEINILEGIPNKTKIIIIYFHDGRAEKYRAHISTRPPKIEYDSTFIYGGRLPPIWVYYPLEIEKRFERYKRK